MNDKGIRRQHLCHTYDEEPSLENSTVRATKKLSQKTFIKRTIKTRAGIDVSGALLTLQANDDDERR